MQSSKEAFLALVRLGIGRSSDILLDNIDWNDIQALANMQGLGAVVLDGVESLSVNNKPHKKEMLQWIGEVLQSESIYAVQQKVAAEMALLFHNNQIRTYVLKGEVVAECYPRPQHRISADLDCFLIRESIDSIKKSDQESNCFAWSFGNELISAQGFEVDRGFYKDSTFYLPGLTVENHRYLTPFRGNKTLAALERVLQTLLAKDKGDDKFDFVWLYRPPVMVTSLFLIEHAYSHFLHEGLTWKQVLDWVLFSERHKKEIDWVEFNVFVDEFGFRPFFETYCRLGKYLLGEMEESELSKRDKYMIDNIWAGAKRVESFHGIKAKFSFAFNTILSWRKYHYFAGISMFHALWIQVKGFLFIKNPTLE